LGKERERARGEICRWGFCTTQLKAGLPRLTGRHRDDSLVDGSISGSDCYSRCKVIRRRGFNAVVLDLPPR
jgi:hypothetical protein